MTTYNRKFFPCCWLCCHIVAALTLLLAACSTDDGAPTDQPLVVTTTVEPWQVENMDITRSTLSELEASTGGFGLYCSEFSLINIQVKYEHEGNVNEKPKVWSYDGMRFWPQGVTTASFYAYAPYDNSFGASINTTSKELTFPYHGGYTTIYDVLYACHENVQRGQRIELHFQHALAKLKWGTVTNNSGINITAVKLTASLYEKAVVNLLNGIVSGTENKRAVAVEDFTTTANTPIMLIPQDNMTLTFELTYANGQKQNIEKTMNIEAGKEYIFNLTISMNHEVVISN